MLIRLLVMACVALAIAPSSEAQTLFRPVAVVDDSVITGYDLAQRTQILEALGAPADSPEALRNAALDQLVNDRLKLKAGKRLGFEPSDDVVKTGIEEFASRLNVTPDEFTALMRTRGISDQAVADLTSAEVIWIQVVRNRFAGRIEPSQAEIDAELDLLRNRQGASYLVQEIGLPLEVDGRSAEETRALAADLSRTLNAGGDFEAAVKQYSRAPSAQSGGQLGWISATRMPPELALALARVDVGQVTEPLSVSAGISLLKVLDKRVDGNAGADDPALRERVRIALINRQSNRLAEGLLQEMRRDALIEIR